MSWHIQFIGIDSISFNFFDEILIQFSLLISESKWTKCRSLQKHQKSMQREDRAIISIYSLLSEKEATKLLIQQLIWPVKSVAWHSLSSVCLSMYIRNFRCLKSLKTWHSIVNMDITHWATRRIGYFLNWLSYFSQFKKMRTQMRTIVRACIHTYISYNSIQNYAHIHTSSTC